MMNSNERFGQIEAMLADLLRRMDRQSEQIDKIIDILKISDERQTRAEERQTKSEERQEAMLTVIQEHGQVLREHEKRFAEQQTYLKDQGQRQDLMLSTQRQMLELMSHNANKTDEVAQHIPAVIAFENRVSRLEEAVFNKAS